MQDTITPARCPKCGDPIPAEARQGVCPKCALAAAAIATEVGQPAGDRPPPPSWETVAAAFPHLEILGLIGTGGMGAVFKARQRRLDRVVALKLLTPALAGSSAFAERFHREARVLARLNHPGIVSVHDYGEAGGFFYLLMEYVDGVNLRQAMQAGRFTPAQALALVPRICEALQFAHDEGILHRDIKPENLLLDTRGRIKIVDFGIAKLIGDRTKDTTLTARGLAVGTPHYMAPEQLEHPQDVDQRADIYSLGVVFYEMLTGELPLGRFAPPSQKTPVDPRVDDVVLRALEKERERRQHNVTEVKTGVEQITGTPASSPPSPEAVPAPSAPPPKTSLCYVSTPEYLRTLRGRFVYIYQGNGQLRLDDRNLSFNSGWHSVTIPLTSIGSLARGEHSLAAKPIPLHYLEVAFEDHGTTRTLLFTPTRSGLLPAWETNQDVAEWLNAIQTAAERATGRPLPLSRSSGTGRGWGELVKTWGLTVLICSLVFLAIPIVVEQRLPNRWTDYLPGPLLAVISLGLGLSLRAWTERRALTQGNLDELTHLPGSSASRAGGPAGIAAPQVSAVGPTNTARAAKLGWNLFYLLMFLALCFLMIGPWIGDFTGRPFPSPMPEPVGKPVALLTLLLVVYGAVQKSWRLSRPGQPGARGESSPFARDPRALSRTWLSLPASARRGVRITLALIAFMLAVVFASFEKSEDDARHRWSVGAFQPWLVNWLANPPSGVRGGMEVNLATSSFACGLAALLLGLLTARLHRVEAMNRLRNTSNVADPVGPSLEGARGHGPRGTAVLAARVADTGQLPAIPTASTSPGRVAGCYFSNPQRMQNCFPGPQAHIFQCKGPLHLDGEALVFTSPWQTRVVIPWPAISDLSIGQFQMWTTPWVMKYARFHFLSVTYTEAGSSRTVHLMPVDPDGLRSAGSGAALAPWFEAIRQAIVTRTGQSPPTTDPAALAISAEPNWNRKGWPLFLGSLASLGLTCLAIALGSAEALTVILSAATGILWVASLWYAIGFLQANAALRRGDFDAVTSDEPPEAGSPREAATRDRSAYPAPALEPPATPGGPPRFAWMAAASAAGSIPAWVFVIGLLDRLYDSLGPDGLPPRGFSLPMFELVMLGTGGFVGLAALWLGRAALCAIRASQGRLRGARLAATGLLAIPVGLMVKFLPPWFAFLARSVGWQPSSAQGEFFTATVLVGILLLTAWAGWRLRQWARQGGARVRPHAGPMQSVAETKS
ncbi:MAG: serine/threonine protein kinase [Verrucomicrobiales bacterium]|nr:serine/threonine protein kinase [Verrucomicrobiales bacterium]